jgi:hypothetical protein
MKQESGNGDLIRSAKCGIAKLLRGLIITIILSNVVLLIQVLSGFILHSIRFLVFFDGI